MNGGPEMLARLQARRSVRTFSDVPVPRDVLERLVEAATSAPSATNRQPWRFCVVTGGAREALAARVRARVLEMRAIIARGHHGDDFGSYGDFFHEPLEAAQAVIVPSYRTHDDLIAQLVRSGGEDPARYDTSAAMQSELCATAAACMALLVQADAEGIGACWMAGPMVAREEVEHALGIREPYRMLGAIALGWPLSPPAPRPRKPLGAVVRWVDTLRDGEG
ncbi:MAG: nitroreductase family protein [Pseudomonadota bacterium]|nr:nitroreductase family protein [Pseudomonadota bacterium]